MTRNTKRRKKKEKRKYIIGLLIIVIILLIWANINSNKIQVIKQENYIKTYNTTAYILKNEQSMLFNNEIDFTVNEGLRIPMNKIISTDKNITNRDYINHKIDIIQWKLDNEAYFSGNLFQKDLDTIEEDINKLEEKIKQAEKSKNTKEVKNLTKERDNLLYKKNMIIESFQYIGLNQETLQELKSDYTTSKSSTGSLITLNNLDFDFPGYIYFNNDGYEELLNINVLEYISPNYLSKIDERYKSNEQQAIKIIDDDYLYFTMCVPSNIEIEGEEITKKKKDKHMELNNYESLNQYYSMLNTRFDILLTFPTVKFSINDKSYRAYFIDVRQYGNEKLVVLQLKENICSDIINNRVVDIKLHTYEEEGYKIPRKSIVENEQGSNIVVMSKGYIQKYINIEISKYDDKYVFLDTDDNENIQEGMQLIINP